MESSVWVISWGTIIIKLKAAPMSDLAFVTEIVEHLRNVDSDDGLLQIVDDVSRGLGFDHFAMIHHADLSRLSTSLIHIDTYPAVWREHFVANGIYLDDPVLHACVRTHLGFAWNDVAELITLSPRQRGILESARDEGIGEGFTVPISIPGEVNGSCSFATRFGKALPHNYLIFAQLLGSFAFQAARRLKQKVRLNTDRRLPMLTPRQRECVVLVGNGKTDWEIATILGLREDTVTKYLNAARERYGVARRMQLVVAAIYDGQISLGELQCPLKGT
jgi:LuxR family transcriptional regulator, quorum-sensing system regulator CciR